MQIPAHFVPSIHAQILSSNIALGLVARIGLLEKEYYCEDCHYMWPHEGAKPRRDRPNMAPYYFIEGIEQTAAPDQPHGRRTAKRREDQGVVEGWRVDGQPRQQNAILRYTD